jgi:hypothetical protein
VSTLLAGAARRDVTPSGSPRLAGHASRTTASEGVASPLAVRVVAVSDGSRTVLLGVADALWWPPEASDEIRARVAGALGLEEAAVILHATHSHSAPQPSTAFAPTLGEPDPDFMHALEQGVLDAGREALANLTACRVFAGTANEAIGVHRRTWLDGRIQMAPNRDVVIDDRIRVVQLRTGGEVVATVMHHACHPTTTGENLVSSDYPGALARRLDEYYGGTSLVLQGCAGDVRPALLNADGTFRLGDEAEVETFGSRLAAAVERGLTAGSELEPGPVSAHLEHVDLTLESGTRVPLRVVSARLAKGWVLVGLACEPVGRYQQAASDSWVLGYTNGMVGYLPTAQQRLDGGYEPIGSLPHFRLDSPFDEQTESRVVQAITRAAASA